MSAIKFLITDGLRSLTEYGARPRKEAAYFVAHGYEVEVIILHNWIYGNHIEKNRIDGVDATHFITRNKTISAWIDKGGLVKKLLSPYYAYLGLRLLFWLRRYLRKNPCDALFCHNLYAALVGFWARPKSTRLVFVMREIYEGQTTSRLKGNVLKTLSRYMQKKADAIVYVVPYQFETMPEQARGKAIFVPNYSEADVLTKQDKTPSNTLRINYIGGPRDKQSLCMLFEACRGNDAVSVAVHGQSPNPGMVEQMQREYPYVTFTGKYEYKTQSAELYANTDILFCVYNIGRINDKHSYPIKLFEGIATETPMIVNDEMDGALLVKEHDIGWTFSYYEKDALKRLIERLCVNQDEIRRKTENLKKISNDFLWESVAPRLEKALQ